MTDIFSPKLKQQASEAAAPILLAAGGALESPTVNPQKAQSALEKLRIPTTGKVLVTISYEGCGTHDYPTLEKAAAANGAKLYVIYGQPEDVISQKSYEQKDNKGNPKLSIAVSRRPGDPLHATIIMKKKNPESPSAPDQFLSLKDVDQAAGELGLILNRNGIGLSSVAAALYENGKLIGIIPDGQTTVPVQKKAVTLRHPHNSGIILG